MNTKAGGLKLLSLKNRKKIKGKMGEKSEESLRDFWDSIKWTCMPVGRVPDGEGKEKEQRVYLKR